MKHLWMSASIIAYTLDFHRSGVHTLYKLYILSNKVNGRASNQFWEWKSSEDEFLKTERPIYDKRIVSSIKITLQSIKLIEPHHNLKHI